MTVPAILTSIFLALTLLATSLTLLISSLTRGTDIVERIISTIKNINIYSMAT
nr:hypothetical protein [uncultured Methanosphaera sp.]